MDTFQDDKFCSTTIANKVCVGRFLVYYRVVRNKKNSYKTLLLKKKHCWRFNFMAGKKNDWLCALGLLSIFLLKMILDLGIITKNRQPYHLFVEEKCRLPTSHWTWGTQLCTLRGFMMEKNKILALDLKGIISINPDSCIFPYIEKC